MSTFEDILNKRYIFLGGKGGVGKTSSSCSLALKLSELDRKILLISTDPAHNLSDAFGQKFNNNPQKVNNTDNLYCLEIDPEVSLEKLLEKDSNNITLTELSVDNSIDKNKNPSNSKKLKKLLSACPGIDEAVTFLMLVKNKINQLKFESIQK